MTTPQCQLCGRRRGERPCPALGVLICSSCCGRHRGRSVACPADCRYLQASEQHLRARRARELDAAWKEFASGLSHPQIEELFRYVLGVEKLLAFVLHTHPATDQEVQAALDYLARSLSPIELGLPPPNELARALEEELTPAIRRLEGEEREFFREACRVVTDFIAFLSGKRGPADLYVKGLLGLYPAPPEEKPGLILRP